MAIPERTSILEVLLHDADLSAFEAAFAEARSPNLSPGQRARLEKERAIGLRLREKLIRHRRNEAELQLLNDTANDLASMHDLDTILQAISNRARRLLDSDLAYISLSDHDRGDSFIKAASGNISSRLQGLRLPKGIGVGGLVSRTSEPCAVTSYMNDDSIIRSPEVDATVTAERIESLLGVPVQLKHEVIGVLMAAHRSVRGFSSHDINALAMLANHAAVAIENSRLLTAAQTAVAELRVANATIRSHVDDLERTAEVHERLSKLVIQGKGVDDVVQATAAAVSGRVAVLDAHGTPIAVSTPEPLDLDPGAITSQALDSGHTIVSGRMCAVPMITESEMLGAIVLISVSDIDDTDRRILERAALVAALVLVGRRRMAEAQARVRGELLAELLTRPNDDYDLLRHRASLLDVDLDACTTVVVAHIPETSRERTYTMIAAFARRWRGLATHHRGAAVFLLPGADPVTVAREAARELSRTTRHPVTAGAAHTAHPAAAASAYEEAANCMRALLALGRAGDVADTRDLGFVGALFSGEPDIPAFIRSTLGPVIEYDRAHRTELAHTLDVYCSTNQTVTDTAQILHLHPNTVTQRLTRVAQLLGDTWRHADRLLEIQIALRLLKVSQK